ncbi:DUF2283 domain-containing protein [Methanobacterium alkalithermotolerans]|uniref:DUF2283 domain-containing protein n=1 Tax=Methanobacterium alkalithermotolerans TaxID=2731220 RepID=A0A8T8K2G7_9EURY|nr:DUF2283 domain-containing protein [Methanobacterium alkalithermotolerans]QUH22638.1 DUF2283 domain-containing protein [Methanobacterium alkalithermotolerans]
MINKKPEKMGMEYDLKNDSLFLYKKDKTNYNESIEIGEDFILDFDENSVPISFEMLDVSKILGVKKFSVKNLKKLSGVIGISKDSIRIKLEFIVPAHREKLKKPVLFEVPNDFNLPNTITNLDLAKA